MIDAKHPMQTAKLWVLARGKFEPFVAFAPVEQNRLIPFALNMNMEMTQF